MRRNRRNSEDDLFFDTLKNIPRLSSNACFIMALLSFIVLVILLPSFTHHQVENLSPNSIFRPLLENVITSRGHHIEVVGWILTSILIAVGSWKALWE